MSHKPEAVSLPEPHRVQHEGRSLGRSRILKSCGGDRGGWGRRLLLLDARECSWTGIQSRLSLSTRPGGQCLAGGPSGAQKAGLEAGQTRRAGFVYCLSPEGGTPGGVRAKAWCTGAAGSSNAFLQAFFFFFPPTGILVSLAQCKRCTYISKDKPAGP